MSTIFGLANLNASDYQYARNANQQLVYSATQMYVATINADVMAASAIFIDGSIEKIGERYQLPGSGRMNRRGSGTRGPAVRANGAWDVQYPLEDFGERLVTDDVDFAYMTPDEYQRHVDTIRIRYLNEMRHQILHRLMDNQAGSTESFIDEREGTLSIRALANGEAAVYYPPVLGATAEATENHYLESGYASASISDANNPIATMVNELEEHFGAETGNSNIIVFHNNAETAILQDLSDFLEVPDNFVAVGDNTDIPVRLPTAPGRIHGRTNGAWLSEWRWMPANYMLAIHLEEPAPLKMRLDPAATGLPRGLALVANDMEYPLANAEWRARFGIGTSNRLNGVAMELGTGGTYTVPTAYD